MLHDNSGPVLIVPRMIIHHDQELLGGPVHHGLQRSLVDWLERRRAAAMEPGREHGAIRRATPTSKLAAALMGN